jgi:hypothetical protein
VAVDVVMVGVEWEGYYNGIPPILIIDFNESNLRQLVLTVFTWTVPISLFLHCHTSQCTYTHALRRTCLLLDNCCPYLVVKLCCQRFLSIMIWHNRLRVALSWWGTRVTSLWTDYPEPMNKTPHSKQIPYSLNKRSLIRYHTL